MSEIEPQEVIEPIVTISPEITHEELEVRPIEEPLTDRPNQIEQNPDQTFNLNAQEKEAEELETAESEEPHAPSTGQKKRRRKGKNEYQEDDTIDDEFASRLDMSCIEDTPAPSVNDAYIVEYIRYDLFLFQTIYRK